MSYFWSKPTSAIFTNRSVQARYFILCRETIFRHCTIVYFSVESPIFPIFYFPVEISCPSLLRTLLFTTNFCRFRGQHFIHLPSPRFSRFLLLAIFPTVETFSLNVSNSSHFFARSKCLLLDIFRHGGAEVSNSRNFWYQCFYYWTFFAPCPPGLRTTPNKKKPKPHRRSLARQLEYIKPARPTPVGFGLLRHMPVHL